jgi:hypothetical protein
MMATAVCETAYPTETMGIDGAWRDPLPRVRNRHPPLEETSGIRSHASCRGVLPRLA